MISIRISIRNGWREIPAPAFVKNSPCAKRYPSWEEIKQARYDLVPDGVTMAMLLPPSSEFVNVMPNGSTRTRQGI